MTEPISEQVLAEIDERAPFCRSGCDASLHARAMTGEIRSLRSELAKYVGWEPTVKEEYDHAVAQSDRIDEIVREFKRNHEELWSGPDQNEAVVGLIVAIERTLGAWRS